MKIESEEQLRSLYGFAKGRAQRKILQALEKHSFEFIGKSPFMLLSTTSRKGELDCSPRGGEPGFVKAFDETSLIIPDSKGNNRLDSIVNIIETNRVGCLFLIPGVDETLRVNGAATISVSPDLLKHFDHFKNPPNSVIHIKVTEVFLHCAKALMRSKLWSSESQIDRSELPTMGQMLNEQIGENEPMESQQEMVERYLPDL